MANLAALQAELFTLFNNTSNLTATEKTKVRNRFVSQFPGKWIAFLAENGGSNTAAVRGDFVCKCLVDFMKEKYGEGSRQENLTALPADETLG
jgi:hypothetical protein